MTCFAVQNDLSKPLAMENIDTGSGVLFPFWDEGTRVVYIIGKVECRIECTGPMECPEVTVCVVCAGRHLHQVL